MERGAEQRATGATKLNEHSSRSHAVFIIIVEKSTSVSSEASANGEQMAAFQGLHPGPLRNPKALDPPRACTPVRFETLKF